MGIRSLRPLTQLFTKCRVTMEESLAFPNRVGAFLRFLSTPIFYVLC